MGSSFFNISPSKFTLHGIFRGFFITFLFAIFLLGCSPNGDLTTGCGISDPTVIMGNEVDHLLLAEQNYNDNPSAENCALYKQAFKEYLDEWERLLDCVPGPTLQASLDEAHREYAALCK